MVKSSVNGNICELSLYYSGKENYEREHLVSSKFRVHLHTAGLHWGGKNNLGGGDAEVLQLPNESVQFGGAGVGHLNQHGVVASHAVTLQYVAALANERIKFGFLVRCHLQVNKGLDVIAQLDGVQLGTIAADDALPLQLFNTGRNGRCG